MKNRKIALGIIAGVMALALTITGTLMLFTSESELATNVVTFGDLRIHQEEKGGKLIGEDEDHADGYVEDYTTVTDGTGGAFTGINYLELGPGEKFDKLPRVVHDAGVDAYLRVMSSVKVYDNSDVEEARDAYRAAVAAFESAQTASSVAQAALESDPTNNDLIAAVTVAQAALNTAQTNKNTAQTNLNTAKDQALLNDEPMPYTTEDGVVGITNVTGLLDLVQAIITAANNTITASEWSYSPIAGSLDGFYYYNDSAGLLTFSEFGETEPIFTSVTIPNFTEQQLVLLRKYRIDIELIAQAVQINGNTGTTGNLASYFAAIE
ncbi:MAG: hypothetical protein LBU32_11895 [Clostridiales bacterium]|jgi:predicted ribosomally synthesized peptide with SipW-like signal peptide|nr:hypothetical protein [Clostridiales bacterium]